ncbi:F0F1 ATP synthase subunit delta [Sphingobacterium sp. UT-1RO-CII-1]|uniref:F0F1 ATP synthase subunit delta n=1 Tax=Sphingobacterium sp. UT-1RO-CII-1 TaxID=2995225 RepID=UPI00227B7F4F|nr:F0F1 ATP synthase subunit delta [Sphingobacterium sp. UT-1RO-CII-1]MCY4779842.1 F0F1 ATP synthase subunit delta [Sphingobacterium sp. UT-1RO-CII-1]
MSIFTVASRYAKSLIELAEEQNNLDAVKSDVEAVISILKSNSELLAVLKNPIIAVDKKQNILAAIFKDKANQLIVAFFNILVSKGRSNILLDIMEEFIREYNEKKGIVKATVTSATVLSETNLAELQNKITQEVNAQVILKNIVDPTLIGGFIVRVGDRQIDVSIAGKLNKLEKHFVSQGI